MKIDKALAEVEERGDIPILTSTQQPVKRKGVVFEVALAGLRKGEEWSRYGWFEESFMQCDPVGLVWEDLSASDWFRVED